LSEIEYIIVDNTPVETNWFPLGLPMFRCRRTNTRYPNTTIQQIKKLMREAEFTINVDFKIVPNYYGDTVILKLHPRIQSYASWILLMWEQKREEYE
jgi:hypothetical protein